MLPVLYVLPAVDVTAITLCFYLTITITITLTINITTLVVVVIVIIIITAFHITMCRASTVISIHIIR